MKLSDYVASFLKKIGVKKAFVLQGGASAHLIDSIAYCDGIDYICNQHEQATAMSADGYARISKELGVAISTSGPGATNLLTGCATSYYDSIPVLFLTGQVASFRLKGDLKIRQLGFQETDTVDIFSPVTKYATLLEKPDDIAYELEKAVFIAMQGRKGPVLIDIPDDYQRADIDVSKLRHFDTSEQMGVYLSEHECSMMIARIVEAIKNAHRPVLLAGRGIHLAEAEQEFAELVEMLKIPVLLTWGANDLLKEKCPWRLGTIGINGSRYGNITAQKADFVLVIGSRLDTHVAGTPLSDFLRQAERYVIDIDEGELAKYERLSFDAHTLQMDAKKFSTCLIKCLAENTIPDNRAWLRKCISLKERFPICEKKYYEDTSINPYIFVRSLSAELENDDVIFCDTGCSFVWMNQAFEFKNGQRIHSSFNNTPMGYSLPGAVGAATVSNKRIICITGDGGFQMNMQELATVARLGLNIKLLLFDNQGYGMIQRTQDMWFGSRYVASDVKSGLGFPDYTELFKAYGIPVEKVAEATNIEKKLKWLLSFSGAACLDVVIPLESGMYPQLKAGHRIEDMEPLLPESDLLKIMAE